jgi:hypothetical protein
MANELILQRLEGVRQALVALFESGTKLSTHSDIIGDEREIFVSHFLIQILPPHYRIGSGVITDAQGSKSTQLDIVIELPFTPSFSFVASTPRVYLADTIGAVIEVKSDLEGYLTGTKAGNAERKFIIGSTGKGREKKCKDREEKYKPLKEIKRNVLVVERNTNDGAEEGAKDNTAKSITKVEAEPDDPLLCSWIQRPIKGDPQRAYRQVEP